MQQGREERKVFCISKALLFSPLILPSLPNVDPLFAAAQQNSQTEISFLSHLSVFLDVSPASG